MEVERRYATESLCRENRGLKPTATVGPRYARESPARRVPWMLPNCIVTPEDDTSGGARWLSEPRAQAVEHRADSLDRFGALSQRALPAHHLRANNPPWRIRVSG